MAARKLTIDEIRDSTRPYLVPEQVRGVLGCDPQALRIQARERPERLGFPVIVLGTRVRIPRLPFLKFLEGGEPNEH